MRSQKNKSKDLPCPEGYITRDMMWAAVPFGDQYITIHNGKQVHLSKTLELAKDYIAKEMKKSKHKKTPLEEALG
jgi:hypothetical protein